MTYFAPILVTWSFLFINGPYLSHENKLTLIQLGTRIVENLSQE